MSNCPRIPSGYPKSVLQMTMSQQNVANPQVIYDTLVADSTFMANIGSYTFKSGDVVPSILVATPGVDLPPVLKQEGLECIIHDVGDTRNNVVLSGQSMPEMTWRMFFIVWDGADGSQLQAAVEQTLSHFPLGRSFDTVVTSQGLGARVQTQVQIPSICPVL